MDKTVIEEIADQLGLAVDQAGDFIAQYLPQYAALKAATGLFGLAMFTLACGIIAAVCVHFIRKRVPEGGNVWKAGQDRLTAWRVLVSTAIIWAVSAGVVGCGVIGWAFFPEAQLIQEAMNAVG